MKALAALRVVNAVQDGAVIKMNSYVGDSASSYNSGLFNLIPDGQSIYLYPAGDSLKPYVHTSLPLQDRDIYSIFVAGEKANPDHVIVKENLPNFYEDSAVGVRVINLCKGSGGLNITVASSPSTTLLGEITYLKLSDFVKIPLPKITPVNSVTFLARNSMGDLIASYTLPANPVLPYATVSVSTSRRRTITLVIKGAIGAIGNSAPGIFPVANY